MTKNKTLSIDTRYQILCTATCTMHCALYPPPTLQQPPRPSTTRDWSFFSIFSGFNFVIIYNIVTISYNRHVSSISVYFNSILESFLKVKGTLGVNVKLIAAPLYCGAPQCHVEGPAADYWVANRPLYVAAYILPLIQIIH